MSKQVCFFGDSVDLERLHAWLRSEFDGWFIIRSDRGSIQELEPLAITTTAALGSSSKSFIVSADEARNVELAPRTEAAADFIIFPAVNPVLEYSPPSMLEDGRTCHVGRLYWAFAGRVSDSTSLGVSRILRWVRGGSQAIPGYEPIFRILPHAAKSVDYLQAWAVQPTTNPLKPREESLSS